MTAQIAVKLPDELLAGVDGLVAAGTFESRSDAVRHALDSLLHVDHRRRIDAAFADGFRRHPESEGEMADAERLAVDAIADEPWERWW